MSFRSHTNMKGFRRAIAKPYNGGMLHGNNCMMFLLVFLSLLCYGCSDEGGKGEKPAVNLYSSVSNAGRIELARMAIGKVGTVEDPSFRDASGIAAKAEALMDKMKVGQRIAVYSYDTYLRASIDMTVLRPEDIEVDEENHTVRLKLPPVKVEYEGRDITLREEHYRVSGLRTDISPAERARLKEQMNREVKKEVASDHALSARLKATAERRAIAYFTSLLADMGYQAQVSVSK